jgi:hypothetical protein
MNRRNFIGTVGAAIAAVILPSKAKAESQKKWWSERHSTFDGYPITYYDWPKDRLICMANNDNEIDTVWVPSFALSELPAKERTINIQIRRAIDSAKKLEQDFSHIYLFKIDGEECQYAILLWHEAHPTLDYFGPHLADRKIRQYKREHYS